MWLTDDELIQDAYPSFSDDELRIVEELLGFCLPQQYREFLAWRNGGTCPEYVQTGHSDVTDFIPLKQDLNAFGLLETREGWSNLYPDELLAIAGNGGGDYFCLHIGSGKIYLPSHDDPFQDFALLEAEADSLEEFLLGLWRELPEDEVPQTLPEFIAVGEGNRERLRDILKYNFKPDLKNEHGETLLTYGIRLWRRGIVEDLIEAGANAELQDDDGYAPLFAAASAQTLDIGRSLIRHGVNVNGTDDSGQSVLIHSISCGNLRLARELIAAGADLDYTAPNGISALELSKSRGLI